MTTKICSKCKESKSLNQFYFRNKMKGTRQHYCIPCLKGYKDAHYRNNRASYIKRCGERRDRIAQETDGKLVSYLLEHPCVDCGEADITVLDFDHKDPSKKDLSIAVMRLRHYSWERISSEITKCSVRCANCHRRRTAKQFNWYKQK